MYGSAEATDKLFAAMQRGELKAKDLIPKLTKEFAAFADAGLPSATKSIGAEIERFTNSMFGLFTGIGEAGALAGVTAVIRTLADVIRGLTPILAKLIGTFSFFARVLLIPIETLAKALKLITKIDDGIGFLIGRIGEFVGASKGIIDFTKNLFSLSTVLAFTFIAPMIGKATTVLGKFLMLSPMVRAATVAWKGYFATLAAGNGVVAFLSKGFTTLAARVGLANTTMLGFIGRIILPFLALAAVIEDVTAVTNDNKDSLLKWALNAEGAVADFVRGPLAILSAGILTLDQLFANFFGKDLKEDRLRRQVEDIFKIKIDPKATLNEIWDTFWNEAKIKTSESDTLLGKTSNKIVVVFHTLFQVYSKFIQAITAIPRHILNSLMSEDFFGTLIQPFKDAWAWISNIFTNKLPSIMKSAGASMLEALKSTFVRPFQNIWNKLADKVPGMDKIGMGEEGSRKSAGLSKTGPVQPKPTVTLPKPIPLPRKEAGLDTAFNRVNKPVINMTVSQTVNAAPGMSEEAIATSSARQIEVAFQEKLAKTIANSPATE